MFTDKQDAIKKAAEITQHAQRNYDLSKTIPASVLNTLIYVATNSPSKQNESHFELQVFTDLDIIRQIYDCTKLFMVRSKAENKDLTGLFEEKDGKFWQNEDRSVKNSQIYANALFVFIDYDGVAVGGTHQLAQRDPKNNPISVEKYNQQKNFSIGIAVGELILSAGLLGYKTGICSAFKGNKVEQIINSNGMVKLLVGVGFENENTDRRLHAETLNRDLPPLFRNGELDQLWRFPALPKDIKVKLNGQNI